MPLPVFSCWKAYPAGEAGPRGKGLALPSLENVAILKRKKGGKRSNTYRPGRLGEFVEAFFPVECINRIQPRQCSSTAGAAFLALHGEEPINQTLERVDCNDFEHVPESPHKHTPFPGPA